MFFSCGQNLSLTTDIICFRFDVSLKNVQLLVALQGERWDSEMTRHDSPLFLLTPTTLNVELGVCLVQTKPELPKFRVEGKLNSLSVNVADYRLIKLVEILDSLIAPEMSPPLDARYCHSRSYYKKKCDRFDIDYLWKYS